MDRHEQKFFDIPLFSWEAWGRPGNDFLQFYNVEFPYESMKKYNGSDVSLNINGELSITSECKELWRGFAVEIPEFLEEVKKRFGEQ